MPPSRRVLAKVLLAHGASLWGGLAEYDPVKQIESARVYGNINEYAYYYVDLEVGRPSQRVSVIVDTGSELAAFPCKGCDHCGTHIDPLFNVRASETASWIGCGGWCQGVCKDNRCAYYQGYMEGSSISGWWFEDEVRLGENFSDNPPVRSKMGCHNKENKLFYDQKANGIFGLGPSERTLLQDLFADQGHVDASIFSLCFADWGGRLVVGGHNDSYHTGPVQYMQMAPRSGQYVVHLTSMIIDGNEVGNEFGTTFIDSGTTYTYMSTAAYKSMRSAVEGYCNRHNSCGAYQSGKCWRVNTGVLPELFPNVTMVFSGRIQMSWSPRSYMYQRGSTPEWCYAFEDDGPGAGTTLGASWMIHQDVIFDMKAMRVGIAPADCPEYKRRIPGESAGFPVIGSASTELTVAIARFRTRHQAIWWAAAMALFSMSLLACIVSGHEIVQACNYRLVPGSQRPQNTQQPVHKQLPQHDQLDTAAGSDRELELGPVPAGRQLQPQPEPEEAPRRTRGWFRAKK